MSVRITPPIEGKKAEEAEEEAPRRVELPYNFEKELIENQNRHFCGHYTYVPCKLVEPMAKKFYARHDQNTLDYEKFTEFVKQRGRRRARGILPHLSGEVYGWLPAQLGESVRELNFICAPKIRTDMTIHGERVISERVTERPSFKELLQAVSHIRPYFHRPLGIVFGNKSVIYVDDPETMEQFFNAPECIDKSFFQDGFCLKRGLLHAKGAAWKSRRRQLDPAFGSKVLLSFIDTFNTVGNQLVHKFESELLGDNIEFETLDEMFSRAVLEVSCQTTMGTETNFTAADTQGIAKTYSELMGISALRGTKPWLQVDFLFRWLDAKNYKRSQELMKHLEDFVRVIVEKKHAEWRASGECHVSNIGTENVDANADGTEDVRNIRNISAENTTRKRIFIEQIFHMVDNGELRMEDVMDEALSMLMVSFETISTSVLVIMLLLAMHEKHQRKLREEIAATFTQEQQITKIDPVPLLQMKYLDSLVYESLRLLTTVPFNMRAVSRDFFIQVPSPNGMKWRAKIPKDTAIVFDAFNMQRDPKYWGAHAQEFYPEHFAAGSTGATGRHPYAFVPFAKGLRYCIGNRYSMYLAKIFIVKLIHHFEFGTSTKLSDLHFVNGISLKFGNSEVINFHIKKIERSGV